MMNTHQTTEILLAAALAYANSNDHPGYVVAAAYRLAAAKLHENGSLLYAQDLERVADQAESEARLARGIPRR